MLQIKFQRDCKLKLLNLTVSSAHHLEVLLNRLLGPPWSFWFSVMEGVSGNLHCSEMSRSCCLWVTTLRESLSFEIRFLLLPISKLILGKFFKTADLHFWAVKFSLMSPAWNWEKWKSAQPRENAWNWEKWKSAQPRENADFFGHSSLLSSTVKWEAKINILQGSSQL